MLRPTQIYAGEEAVIPVHDVLLQLRAARPQQVRLVVTIIASSATAAASWSGAIDVDDDGVFDLASLPGQIVRLEVLGVVDSRGLRLRTRSHGQARTRDGGTARGTMQIELLPAPVCTLTSRGSDCGAELSGFVSLGNRLELDVGTSAPAALGKLIFGTSRVNQPLPFSSSCRLYTDPLVALPFQTDLGGSAWRSIDLPPGLEGAFTVQALLLARRQPLELAGSRALDLVCR